MGHDNGPRSGDAEATGREGGSKLPDTLVLPAETSLEVENAHPLELPIKRHSEKAKEVGLSDEQVQNLTALQICTKLKKGQLHAITKEDVQHLFSILDTEERGEISREDLFKLRHVQGFPLTEDDITALAQDCDKDDSGKVSPEELFLGLTQGELAFTMVKAALGKAEKRVDEKHVELAQMIKYMQEEFQTSSALWTLPETFLLFVTFMILMSGHLIVNSSYVQHKALTSALDITGPHDIPSTWTWLQSTFLSFHLNQNLLYYPYPGRVITFNQIVGGIELVKTTVKSGPCDGSKALGSFYDSHGNNQCRGRDDQRISEFFLYHLHSNYTTQQMQNLSDANWLNKDVSAFDIHALYYNAHMKVFTDSHIRYEFLESGVLHAEWQTETFQSDPYFDKSWVIPDIIFAAILLKMWYQETRELIPAMRSGVEGLRNYLDIWNLIDWWSMLLGALTMAYWGMVCTGVSNDLQRLMAKLPKNELDELIVTKQDYLLPSDIERFGGGRQEMESVIGQIHQVSADIAGYHEALRTVVFAYAYVLQMKFFKAFQANPRLDIVIRTLTKSTVEITHFLIIFAVIVLCFSSAAHVVWGKIMPSFRGQWEAMFMCWRILFGDFDVVTMKSVNSPLTDFWFVVYNFLVFLILFNMLLAIIMDTYMAAKQEKGDPTQQLTIWHQIRLAFVKVKECRGHIPLFLLLLELQNKVAPAHPAPQVTAKSLRRAFKGMRKHQADYLMRKTVEYIKNQERISDLSFSDAIRVLGLLKVNMLRIADETEQILEMVRGNQRVVQEMRLNAIMWGLDPDEVAPRLALAHSGGSQGASRRAGHAESKTSKGGNKANHSALVPFGLAKQEGPDQLELQAAAVAREVGKMLESSERHRQERATWFQERFHQLERRAENAERGSSRLAHALQGADFHNVSSKLKQLVHHSSLAHPGPGKPEAGGWDQILDFQGSHHMMPRAFVVPQALEDDGGRGRATKLSIAEQVAAVAHQVEKILEASERQFEELIARKTEESQARQLVWKIDTGIRQLKQAHFRPGRQDGMLALGTAPAPRAGFSPL